MSQVVLEPLRELLSNCLCVLFVHVPLTLTKSNIFGEMHHAEKLDFDTPLLLSANSLFHDFTFRSTNEVCEFMTEWPAGEDDVRCRVAGCNVVDEIRIGPDGFNFGPSRVEHMIILTCRYDYSCGGPCSHVPFGCVYCGQGAAPKLRKPVL